MPWQRLSVPARLAHLYVCDGLSTYRIGDLTGLDRQRVARMLRRSGVTLRPRGAGALRPERRDDPPGLRLVLAELYVRRRLSTPRIGAMLDMPDRTVRDRLRRYGIPLRTRGGWEREDRSVLPPDLLRDLYSLDGLTAQEVASKLGSSRTAVLRNAHDIGLPVRVGGAVPLDGPTRIELVTALYEDPMVAAALQRHGIPAVPPGGPIWRRFPDPAPLTIRLVNDLYWGCGIGLNHVELLTGQPAQTVRGFMARAGITARHPGGRSPFLRRWRQGQAAVTGDRERDTRVSAAHPVCSGLGGNDT